MGPDKTKTDTVNHNSSFLTEGVVVLGVVLLSKKTLHISANTMLPSTSAMKQNMGNGVQLHSPLSCEHPFED